MFNRTNAQAMGINHGVMQCSIYVILIFCTPSVVTEVYVH